MKIIKGFGIFLGTFILYHIIFSSFFPVDENNVLQAPDWYAFVGMILSLLAGTVYASFSKPGKCKHCGAALSKNSKYCTSCGSKVEHHKIDWIAPAGKVNKLLKQNDASGENDSGFIVPRTKRGQTKLAAELLANIRTYVSLANQSEDVFLFVMWYDKALDGFSTLMQLNKAPFKNSPSLDYHKLKDEFQLHLCDAIVRAKESTITEINGKYKNSREFQARALKEFEGSINRVRNRFSQSTAALADESIQQIQRLLSNSGASPSPFAYELAEADGMEGHNFEYWCAELLKKNGFKNVKVTPGSGDQGVDVLAEKDGIRYAVQCKCYSSDLGNTPIQEVNTGKTVYHCQIGAVMTNRYFTKGAKEAAEATGVLLWDRDKLQEMIKGEG